MNLIALSFSEKTFSHKLGLNILAIYYVLVQVRFVIVIEIVVVMQFINSNELMNTSLVEHIGFHDS